MTLFDALRRWLEGLQRRFWIRIAASVLVVLLALLTFGRAAWQGQTFIDRFLEVRDALVSDEAHVYAVDLVEQGSATIEGEIITLDPEIAGRLVSDKGEINNIDELVALVMMPLQPDNVPGWLWKEPSVAWGMAVALAATGLIAVWTGLIPLLLLLGVPATLVTWLLWLFGLDSAALALGSAATLLVLFHALTRLLMVVMERFGPVGAVAATVLREAGRSRVALAFVLTLLVLLPLLPLSLDSAAPLRHQVQALLDRSLSLTYAMIAIMTMALACSTIAFDIRDRHIWHLVSKPLGTHRYLAGKWIGIVALNAVVLTVGATFAAAWTGYLRWSPPPGAMNAAADIAIVNNEILTAHAEKLPEYETLSESEIRNRVEAILRDDPEYVQYAEGTPPPRLVRVLRQEVRDEYSRVQRRAESVLNQAQEPWETITFTGLGDVKRDLEAHEDESRNLRLRFKLYGGSSDEHQRFLVGIAINGQLERGRAGAFIPTVRQQIMISPRAIRDDGTLEVSFVNLTHWPVPAGVNWQLADLRAITAAPPQREPFAIFWEAEDVELLYPAGGFVGTYSRAMVVQWVRLAALAAIACFTATFLSFPVACLASMTILVGASLGPFLAQSLGFFMPPPFETVEGVGATIAWLMDSFIRTVATSLVYLLGAFGEFATTERVIQGRVVGWDMVWRSVLQLGVFWCVPLLLTGWAILRSRQLALYSGDS